MAALVILVVPLSGAVASSDNPYVGAYPGFGDGKVSYVNEFWFSENYTGTNTASISNAVGVTVSIAGAKQTCTLGICSEISSGWVYQAGTAAISSNGWNGFSGSSLETAPQVWDGGNETWHGLSDDLGALSSIAYVDETVYLDSGTVVFVYATHLTSGTITTQSYSFPMSQYGDPDNDFQIGTVATHGSPGCPDGIEEHFQVGVETQGSGDTGWKISYNVEGSYTVGWTKVSGGQAYYWGTAGDGVNVTQGADDCITDSGSTSGPWYVVGGSDLTGSNALYYDLNDKYAPGVVDFYYKSGSTVPDETQLWPSLSVDGENSSRTGSVTSVSTRLTTSNSNDLIYVACVVKPLTSLATVSNAKVTSPTLGTYTQRASVSETGAGPADYLYAYTFYAKSSGKLSSEKITCSATLSSGSANMDILVWGISGVNTASPFDSHSGVPDTCYSNSATGSLDCLSFTTSNANDMVLGVYAQLGSGTTFRIAAGYDTIDLNNGGPSSIAIYRITNSTGTYQPSVTSSNTGGVYVAIGDAIVAAT